MWSGTANYFCCCCCFLSCPTGQDEDYSASYSKSEFQFQVNEIGSRSKTRKRLKERFLIRRNRTKRANCRCNHLFQATYNTTENISTNLSLSVRCQEAGGRKRAKFSVLKYYGSAYIAQINLCSVALLFLRNSLGRFNIISILLRIKFPQWTSASCIQDGSFLRKTPEELFATSEIRLLVFSFSFEYKKASLRNEQMK